MDRFLPLILLLTLLSCSNEKEDAELAFKKDVCKRSIAYGEYLVKDAKREYGIGGSDLDYKDSLVFAHVNKIASWRRSFISKPTKEHLFLYADSIEASYKSYSGFESDLIGDIKRNKDLFLANGDSLSFYNLLYYSSIVENSLINKLIGRVSTYWPAFYTPSYLDKKVYHLNDLVYLTISVYGIDEDNLELDLSKVTYAINGSKAYLKPDKIVKSGPNYILIYKPVKKGNYRIEGDIVLKQSGNFTSEARILNDFRVVSDHVAYKKQ